MESHEDASVHSSVHDDQDVVSEEELKSIIADAEAALAQMQSTVNEVLDFRAIESGMSNLKLNKEPAVIADVSRSLCLLFNCICSVGVCVASAAGYPYPDAVSSIPSGGRWSPAGHL